MQPHSGTFSRCSCVLGNGIPQPFRDTVRCSRIHLHFWPLSATLICQLSLVRVFDTNPLRYIVPRLFISAVTASDVTDTAFCRKIYHADRLCPWLFTPRTLSNSDRRSTMGATSCSLHGYKTTCRRPCKGLHIIWSRLFQGPYFNSRKAVVSYITSSVRLPMSPSLAGIFVCRGSVLFLFFNETLLQVLEYG